MQNSGILEKNLLHGFRNKMYSVLHLSTELLQDIQEMRHLQSVKNLDMKIMFWIQEKSLDSG